MKEELLNQCGKWVFLSPVSGLELTKHVNDELRIDKVTFITRAKLPRVRQRIGLPVKVSELKIKYPQFLNKLFNNSRTIATYSVGGDGLNAEQNYLRCVREELDILCTSQLQYGNRTHNGTPNISYRGSAVFREHFMMNAQTKSWSNPSTLTGPMGTLTCDSRWKEYSKNMLFFELLKAIRGELGLSEGWQRDIRNAAILIGQSQQSRNVAQAFLWNMISLETLLSHRGDTYSIALPERIKAFIGWSSNWEIQNYQAKIEDAYTKRCKFVHAGQINLISKEDLLFSDHLVSNVLYNIVAHLSIFKCKDELILFSEKIKAEHTLGIKSKVTPKTLVHWGQPNFKPDDLNY